MEVMTDIPHGTSSGYSWHKCRCDVCVEAKRQRDREYYEKNAEARKAKQTAYYEANREVVNEKVRQKRAANEGFAEADRERHRQWRAENREAHRQSVKDWRKANPEKLAAQHRLYHERHRAERRAKALALYYKMMAENPEKIRAQARAFSKTKKGILNNRAGSARRRGAPYSAEAKVWIASLVDPICAYCGRLATTIDHKMPLSRGGSGELENLVPSCARCNSRKNNKTYEEFMIVLHGERNPDV